MRLILPVAVAVTLAGCGAELPEAWTITGDGAPANTEAIIRIAREQAPCEDVGPWGGTIEFVPEAFVCGGAASANGCAWQNESGAHIRVRALDGPEVSRATIQITLVHELGHVAWERCGKESSDHSIEFMAWVSWTYMAVQARQIETTTATMPAPTSGQALQLPGDCPALAAASGTSR